MSFEEFESFVLSTFIKIGVVLLIFWQGLHPLYTLFAVLVVVDIIAGVLASLVNGQKLSSEVSWRGGLRKVLKALSIGLAAYLEQYVNVALGPLVAAYWCADEGLSIIENYSRAGLPLPQELRDALEKFSSKDAKNKEGK